MFLSKKQPRSVVTRITLWYALICTLFCAAIFALAAVRIKTNILKQIDRMLLDEVREFSSVLEKEGFDGLKAEFSREAEARGEYKSFCRLLSPQGTVLLASDPGKWDGLEDGLKRIPPPKSLKVAFAFIHTESRPFNTRVASTRTSSGYIFQFGINLHSEVHSYNRTLRILGAGLLMMMALSTLSGWLIAHRAMSGVQRVTQAVAGICKDSLHRQVPIGREGREIRELSETFNHMLHRIETLVRELKEVSDNVAHDLRSPLTRMRGAAETTLTGSQDPEAYREMGITILEECDRLGGTINTMLEISQSDAGVLEICRDPVDITGLLRDAVELFLPSAEEKQILLTAQIPENPVVINGDRPRLQRAVANILDNALKYTPSGGRVLVCCEASPNGVQFQIRDTGIGIAPEELPKIFDRFFRSEKCRSTQGNGLGLSLARSILRAHDGTLAVQSTPGEGSCFTIRLPAAVPPTRIDKA